MTSRGTGVVIFWEWEVEALFAWFLCGSFGGLSGGKEGSERKILGHAEDAI